MTAVKLFKSVYVADKIRTKIRVLDHRCALTARVLAHLPLNIVQSGRRRKIQRVRVENRILFPEARRLVEASLPSVLPASTALSYSNVVSRKRVQSVEWETDLPWVSSDNPIQAVSISGRPGSASAGTQASSGSTGPASADARVLCEFAGEKSSKGSGAEPLKTSATGSAPAPVKSAAGPAEPDRSASNTRVQLFASKQRRRAWLTPSKTARKSKGYNIPGRVKVGW